MKNKEYKPYKGKNNKNNKNNNLLQTYIKKMENAINNDDFEDGHWQCDYVLCDLLAELGCGKIVEIYDKQGKWYS